MPHHPVLTMGILPSTTSRAANTIGAGTAYHPGSASVGWVTQQRHHDLDVNVYRQQFEASIAAFDSLIAQSLPVSRRLRFVE